MKKFEYLFISITIAASTLVNAQGVSGNNASLIESGSLGYYQDALRFSSTERGGTARIQGLAGSGTALGGDISFVNINPAGLGFFNKSEFSFTPQYSIRDNSSTYNGSENISFSDNVAIGQIGIVINLSKSDYEKGDFRGGSLAFNYIKRNDFNETIELSGNNFNNSIVDYYLDNAQGTVSSNFYGNSQEIVNPIGLGYDVFLFDIDINACDDPATCSQYERFFDFEAVNQRELIKTKGNQREWSIAYGGNFKDQIYFGGKIGIASIRYDFNRNFSESNLNQNTNALQSMGLNDGLEIHGSGINASFGIIYRPLNIVRFGLSVESPTFYNLEEKFDGNISSKFNDYLFYEDPSNSNNNFYLNNHEASLLPGYFDYVLRTPMKVNFGTAIFAGKNGFITGDVEYLDYRRSRVSFESLGGDENADNKSIRNIYDRTFNFRVGGEYRIEDFRLRAGYGYFGDPFKSNVNIVDQSKNRVSGGFGMRFEDYYWDFAVIQDWYKEGYTLYTLGDGSGPGASISRSITTFAATAGIYF